MALSKNSAADAKMLNTRLLLNVIDAGPLVAGCSLSDRGPLHNNVPAA